MCGEKIALKVLVDQGSQSCFISESAMQLLKLPKIKKSFKIVGIGEGSIESNCVVKLKIFPRFQSSFILEAEAIILKKLTKISKVTTTHSKFDHIDYLLSADPSFTENGPIDLIIGASEKRISKGREKPTHRSKYRVGLDHIRSFDRV